MEHSARYTPIACMTCYNLEVHFKNTCGTLKFVRLFQCLMSLLVKRVFVEPF